MHAETINDRNDSPHFFSLVPFKRGSLVGSGSDSTDSGLHAHEAEISFTWFSVGMLNSTPGYRERSKAWEARRSGQEAFEKHELAMLMWASLLHDRCVRLRETRYEKRFRALLHWQ
jgi:hypothetical protein